MKKFTKLFLALTLLVVGVGTANAVIQKDWTPSTAFGANWNGETNTATWSKNDLGFYLLYTGLTPEGNPNTTAVDLSIYQKLHYNITSLTNAATDGEGAYVELKIGSKNKETQLIKLREGEHDILMSDLAKTQDLTQMLEMTFQGTFTDDTEDGSAVITEFYLYTDRYKYETQKQTVTTNTLGTALSLNDIVKNSTLVSFASGNSILYGTHADNQIYLKPLDDAMSAVEARGANESTYRFRIVEATDGTVPDDVDKLYRIKAFKGDGSALYTGPWGGDGFLNDIGWTYNIAGSDDGCYFAITPVEGKDNTYSISSYQKGGTQRHADIYDKSEWFFNVISQTKQEVDVQVMVEVFVPDTEDPGVTPLADGWISLITNGDLAEDDVTNFKTKNEDSGAIDAVRVADAGRMGGPGIKVTTKDNAGSDWGTQFFVVSSQKLKEGQKLHIEFDYRADRPQTAATQVHRAPGDYNANIDNVNFTVNWQHYSNEFTITSDMCKQDNGAGDFYLQSFGLNLSHIRSTSNFYFDNIVMWTEDDPCKAERTALQNAIALGKAQNSFAKTTESFSALTAAIEAGEGVVESDNATALTNAAKAITDAIAGFKLQDGYTNLTKDMYKKWDSDTTPKESSNTDFAITLNQANGQPFGDSSVKWYHFADMSDFSKFIILVSTGSATPRIMMNRAYAESGDGGSYVELTDAPVDGKVEVDLTAYPYAHMNAIKGVNWGQVNTSGMLLYRSLTITEAGKATFGTLYKTAQLNGATVSAAKYANGKVTLTTIESGIVPAGKGVIVEGSGEIVPTFDVEASDIESDLLVSNGTVEGDGSIYVLAKKGETTGFYKLTTGEKVPAGKAYLKIANESREFIAIDGGATAIKSVETEKANGAIYNLAGQQVKNVQKGIFILNGKKVIK